MGKAIDDLVEELIDKITDKVAEKVADILTKKGTTAPPPNPFVPTMPRDIVVMYGCPIEFTTVADLNSSTSNEITDITTIVENKEK